MERLSSSVREQEDPRSRKQDEDRKEYVDGKGRERMGKRRQVEGQHGR